MLPPNFGGSLRLLIATHQTNQFEDLRRLVEEKIASLRIFVMWAPLRGESLRAFDHFADQAREVIWVDGLDKVIIEPVLQ